MPDTALEGVRVLDLTHGITGPYVTKLFADFGAEVIKIERPGTGDFARRLGPFPNDLPHPEKSGMFLNLNTSKKSVTLNLKSVTGQGIVRRLARDAHLVIENFRPGVMERLGLTYAVLRAEQPQLSLVHISNFGQTGPYRDFAADDMLAYAAGGVLSVTGMPDREPVKLGTYAALLLAGTTCSVMAIGALAGAQLQGIGQEVDISIMEILVGSMDRGGPNVTSFAYSGDLTTQRARDRRATIVPAGTYACADGFVYVSGSPNWWDRFCRTIDRPDLIDNERYLQNMYNVELAGELDALLYEWTLVRGKQEIMERAQREGLPVSAINTMDAVFADPHLRVREFFLTLDQPATGPLEYPSAPFRAAASPARVTRAPLLGEHTAEILGERLGYSHAELAMLRQQDVI